MSRDFDLFVIGGGSGGIAAARQAAKYGAKVGLAEGDRLGGTCVNRGCIPKKLMVYASRFSHAFADAPGFGWTLEGPKFEWSTLMESVNRELKRLNDVYLNLLDKSGVELLPAYATFADAHTLIAGDRRVTADKILIAVGGKPVKPSSVPGIELAMTSDDIFALNKQPERMVILGGGYIGVEFACMFNGLGTQVTQVIRASKVLRRFDDDLRAELQQAMQASGIHIVTDTTDIAIAPVDDRMLQVKLAGTSGSETLLTDTVAMAATGRKPNLEALGLERTQVKIERGAIAVNDNNQTSETHIFAVGDCTNRINLTPVAVEAGRVFADTYFGSSPRTISYENIPTAVFSTPEVATVGLSETAARDRYGDAIDIYRSQFKSTYHSLSGRDAKTLMKLVVHSDTDVVSGAHLLGEHAAEIVQCVAIAVSMGATKADFDATMAIHPSVAEEFVTMR